MLKLDEKGDLFIPLIGVIILLLGALGFGVWAFMGRQDYKNNVDVKITEAVEAAEANLSLKKDAEYAEEAKNPYTGFRGPEAYGTLSIPHPKTWSVYVDQRGRGANPVNGYMHPSFVPVDSSVNYGLRFQVVEQVYDNVLRAYNSPIDKGRVKSVAYRLPKVESVLGTRLEGEIFNQKQGVLILLPLRDKTIKIWTEGSEFRKDFEEILRQFSFIP